MEVIAKGKILLLIGAILCVFFYNLIMGRIPNHVWFHRSVSISFTEILGGLYNMKEYLLTIFIMSLISYLLVRENAKAEMNFEDEKSNSN